MKVGTVFKHGLKKHNMSNLSNMNSEAPKFSSCWLGNKKSYSIGMMQLLSKTLDVNVLSVMCVG